MTNQPPPAILGLAVEHALETWKEWLKMPRIHRALVWLAVVTLVVGLANAAVHAFPLFQQTWPIGYDVTTGLTGSPVDWLDSFGLLAFINAAAILVGGVALAGMVAAWADHRSGWLIAILLVTLLTTLWPDAILFWNLSHRPAVPPSSIDGPGPSLFDMLSTFSVYAVSLIPVVLVLTLALTRRSAASGAGLAAAQTA